MDPRVARLKTTQECESFAKNARRLGHPELADEARRRAVQLRAETHGAKTDVERECLEAVYAYEEVLSAQKGRRIVANRTWPKIRELGVIPAVENIVMKRQESAGFTALVEMGLQDLAFEAVIVRHPESFSAEAVARAKERLAENSAA